MWKNDKMNTGAIHLGGAYIGEVVAGEFVPSMRYTPEIHDRYLKEAGFTQEAKKHGKHDPKNVPDPAADLQSPE